MAMLSRPHGRWGVHNLYRRDGPDPTRWSLTMISAGFRVPGGESLSRDQLLAVADRMDAVVDTSSVKGRLREEGMTDDIAMQLRLLWADALSAAETEAPRAPAAVISLRERRRETQETKTGTA